MTDLYYYLGWVVFVILIRCISLPLYFPNFPLGFIPFLMELLFPLGVILPISRIFFLVNSNPLILRSCDRPHQLQRLDWGVIARCVDLPHITALLFFTPT
jgi:hypothetical protein